MSVRYCYKNKSGERVNLDQIDREMNEFHVAHGRKPFEGLEDIVSETGIMFMMAFGGFTIDRQHLIDWCEEHDIAENVKALYVEFFCDRYTFEAWR
jgi:hypothetical protein